MKLLFLIMLISLSFNSHSHNNGSEHVHNRNVFGSDYSQYERVWCPTDYGHYHKKRYHLSAHYINVVIHKRHYRTHRNRNADRHHPRINRYRARPYRYHRSSVCVSSDLVSVCIR